ncbi:unnamed protein product [Bemisia tabaci]|uniref:Uncharacterized protein n=1 Tax=Bemisia tabaci TaxID=7038 RepID=A0A9P0A3S3_BEMTA|nr:unnamed protein product [Bemisia tabaci]
MDWREPPENLTQLCRLCASNDDVQINIFSDKGREKQLVEKIFSCLSVKVSHSEKLPNSVCYKCMTCLENYYEFRCKCLDVISKLEVLSNRNVHDQKDPLAIKEEPDEQYDTQATQPTDYSKAKLQDAGRMDMAMYGAPDAYKFTCQECGEAFINQNELFLHSKNCREGESSGQSQANPDRPFKCDLCSKSYILSKHLWGHMATAHRGHPAIFCQPCTRTFSSPANLIEHQRSKHGIPGPSNNSTSPSGQTSQANNVQQLVNSSRNTPGSPSPLRKILNSESRKRSIDEACGSRRKNSMPRKISRADEEAGDANLEGHSAYMDNGNTSAQSSSSVINQVSMSQSFFDSNIFANIRNASAQNSNASNLTKSNSNVNGNFNTVSNSSPSISSFNTQPPSRAPSKSKSTSSNNPFARVSQNKESLTCLLCEKTFTKRPLLNKHMRAVHGIDTSAVTVGKIPKSMNDEDIENMMEAETVFCCEICTREFNDRPSMWLHMLHAHRQAAGLACGLCLKICNDRGQLAEHLETHANDGTDQKRFCCSFCGRQDDARPKLIKHAAVHGTTVNTIEIVISNPRYHTHINHAAAQNKAPPVVPPGSVSCKICSRVFGDEEKLIKHCQNAHKSLSLLDHTNNLIFSCEICSVSFSSRSERWTHIYKNHTSDPRVACPIKTCKKVFSSNALLSGHAATHHQEQGEYPNVCEMCGKLFQQRSEFYKHMMGVHPHTLPFVCGVCLKILCSIDELKAHVRDEHEPLPELLEQIRCDICARPYLKHSKMVRHRVMHNDGTEAPKVTKKFFEKPESLNCSLCPDAGLFESIEVLSEHRRKSHNLMVCDLCPKFYAKCSHLWKHVHRCHPGHPDVTCQICSKTSASRIHLKRHIAKLHKDSDLYDPADDPHYRGEDMPHMAASGPHTCEKCKRVFRKYSLLHKHYKHCNGPRPPTTPIPAMVDGVYPCSKCSKTFVLPTALRKHIRSSHIPQVCELCEVSHDTKQELMDHIREKHGTDPRLKCQTEGCSRLFRLQADAERHKKEHASRYFAHLCNFCGDVFTNRKKLRKHLKSNHKDQTEFLCYVCCEPEISLSLLAEHVLEHHEPLLKQFACQLCGKTHSSGSKANEHIRANHGSEYKPCPICWKIFTDKSELETHVENHPKDAPVEKPEPVKKPATKRPSNPNTSRINKELAALTENSADFLSLAKLEDEAGGEVSKRLRRMFSCISCTQSFRVINDLITHRRSVHDEFCCSSCAQQFILEIDFDDHIKVCEPLAEGFVMGGTEKPKEDTPAPTPPSRSSGRTVWASFDAETPCELCDKVWTGLKHYWQHLIRTHKEAAPFACGVCLKLCKDYEDLAHHLDEKHLGTFTSKGNNFVCRVCGRYHNAQRKLQIHMATHTGRSNIGTIPSIRCRHCELVFKTQKFFDEHIAKDHPGVAAEGDAMHSSYEEEIETVLIKDEIHEDDIDMEEVESDAEEDTESEQAEVKVKKVVGEDDDDDDEDDDDEDDDDDDEDDDDEEEDDDDDDNDDIEAEDVEDMSKKDEDDDDDIEDDIENDDIEAEDVDDDEEDDDENDDIEAEDDMEEINDTTNPDDTAEQPPDPSTIKNKANINHSTPKDKSKLKELKLVVPNMKLPSDEVSDSTEKEESMDCDTVSNTDDASQPEAEINVPNYPEATPCIS